MEDIQGRFRVFVGSRHSMYRFCKSVQVVLVLIQLLHICSYNCYTFLRPFVDPHFFVGPSIGLYSCTLPIADKAVLETLTPLRFRCFVLSPIKSNLFLCCLDGHWMVIISKLSNGDGLLEDYNYDRRIGGQLCSDRL
jgi:hypothetical protein